MCVAIPVVSVGNGVVVVIIAAAASVAVIAGGLLSLPVSIYYRIKLIMIKQQSYWPEFPGVLYRWSCVG